MSEISRFPGKVQIWRDRRLPEAATPAGYAALIDAYELEVPLPRTLWGIGEHHRIVEEGGWRLLTPRHAPDPSLAGQLTFALKYEGLDLAVLKRLFLASGPGEIEALVHDTPTGGYARRAWFLYEWLTGSRLNLPDASRGRYVPAVDPNMQYAIDGENSPRHRVRDNLPGSPSFSPLVFRTEMLDAFAKSDLSSRARDVVAKIPRDLLTRAAAFLLLKDSRSSYAIEGERPPQDRLQRWGRAIGQAGAHELDVDELLRLQRLVIGDARFVRLGLRDDHGFVGEHDRETRAPIPVHIDARPEDLQSLVEGLVQFARQGAHGLDPIVAAAMLAFGFVYIHPFHDGNGRVHRYLIHHVLARRRFHPPGFVFPISAAILDDIVGYQRVLESYSSRLLPVIDWTATSRGNVEVHDDTADFYRYFDATPHAEFLYECVRKTVEEDLPRETEFLRRYDAFSNRVKEVVEMPESTIDLLYRFLRQNDGRLSDRAKTREFSAFEQSEVDAVEQIYDALFGTGASAR